MSLYPDISHYHPVENWNQVKAECPFVISKATQGTGYIDETLDSFIKGCEANQISYWLYAYLNKGNELAQAKFLVSTCSSRTGRYFAGYALDAEAGNEAGNVKEALDYLNSLNVKTMVYTGYSSYDQYKSILSSRPPGGNPDMVLIPEPITANIPVTAVWISINLPARDPAPASGGNAI